MYIFKHKGAMGVKQRGSLLLFYTLGVPYSVSGRETARELRTIPMRPVFRLSRTPMRIHNAGGCLTALLSSSEQHYEDCLVFHKRNSITTTIAEVVTTKRRGSVTQMHICSLVTVDQLA